MLEQECADLSLLKSCAELGVYYINKAEKSFGHPSACAFSDTHNSLVLYNINCWDVL